MTYIAEIKSIRPVTHDTNRYIVERPDNYTFRPGQATEIAIAKTGWKDQTRPFTFTSLNQDPFLEFIIKSYPEHEGVTNELRTLTPGDQLILHDVWGAIEYNGPGCFIAGGAGITPFIAILRDLKTKGELANNSLLFSNKTESDIILRDELSVLLGERCTFTLTDENVAGLENRLIDRSFLREKVDRFDQKFYICGPPAMTADVKKALKDLGANSEAMVFER